MAKSPRFMSERPITENTGDDALHCDVVSLILDALRLRVEVIHNAHYCGEWAVDTSGSTRAAFHLITHGECYVESPELTEPQRLAVGDFVLFPKDSEHRLSPSPSCGVPSNQQISAPYSNNMHPDSVGMLCGHIHFTIPLSNPLLDTLPTVVIKRPDVHSECQISALLPLLVAEAVHAEAGSPVTINRLVEIIFILLVRSQLSLQQPAEGFVAALKDQRIGRSLAAIYADPAQKWTVELLAETAGMSRSAFAKRFVELLGSPPLDFIQQWRMQLAWHWLAKEKVTVLVAALRCGYEAEASFAKAFKRHFGQGPGAVRKLA